MPSFGVHHSRRFQISRGPNTSAGIPQSLVIDVDDDERPNSIIESSINNNGDGNDSDDDGNDVEGDDIDSSDDGEELSQHVTEKYEDEDTSGIIAKPDTKQSFPPLPPRLREISSLACWTVSSAKPECSVSALRAPTLATFWQSDGPQPHYLNIHFFKIVEITAIRIYLNFALDESYTPSRIEWAAGMGHNSLIVWGEQNLNSPQGWCWVDMSGIDGKVDPYHRNSPRDEYNDTDFPFNDTSDIEWEGELSDFPTSSSLTSHEFRMRGDETLALSQQAAEVYQSSSRSPLKQASGCKNAMPRHKLSKKCTTQSTFRDNLPKLRCMLLQLRILENHQNGKDTHLRGLQIFSLDSGNSIGNVSEFSSTHRKVKSTNLMDFDL